MRERGLTSLLRNQYFAVAEEEAEQDIEGRKEEDILEEDNLEDILVEDIPVVDKHPSDILPVDNLEEEEHQLEAVVGCNNSSFFYVIFLQIVSLRKIFLSFLE